MNGYFGNYGGQYVSEMLKEVLRDVEVAFENYKDDEEFKKEFKMLLNDYVGRPSPLYFAKNMAEDLGGAKIYLKREDLNHTGAHKINNVIGQMLLAKRMGKKKVIAETGAGQHGVASATVAALMGMKCDVYMGEVDMKRQAFNVYKMELLGARVVGVSEGTGTLKEAVDAALLAYVNEASSAFYVLGSAVGPHPYPMMVKEFQSIISKEMKEQILQKEGRYPDAIIACVGGGSNAIGAFAEFIDEKKVKLIGVEAAGKGVDTDMNAATMANGEDSVVHGMKTICLIDDEGNAKEAYSISAGLDYPGVGPEHANLHKTKRAIYESITDEEAVNAFKYLTKMEGIIPAIESSHAIAYAMKYAKERPKDEIIVVNLSGRGDKDVDQIRNYLFEKEN